MDFPVPVEYFPYLIGGILLAVILFIVYEFRFKEVLQYPLPNEQDLRRAKIWLPKLGKLNDGILTTGRNYFADLFGRILAGTEDTVEKERMLKFREKMEKRFIVAQRVGREKFLYFSDVNPTEDQYNYWDNGVRCIGPVQDCGSIGVFDGFEWVWVKLSKEAKLYNADVVQSVENDLATMKYVRLAATNLSKLKVLEERNKALEDKSERDNSLIATISAKLDRALDALKQKSLSQGPESAKIGGAYMQKLKEWFGPWQLITGGIAVFIAPWIINNVSPAASPPATTYLTIAIAVIGFFSLPLFRKLFGRWL